MPTSRRFAFLHANPKDWEFACLADIPQRVIRLVRPVIQTEGRECPLRRASAKARRRSVNLTRENIPGRFRVRKLASATSSGEREPKGLKPITRQGKESVVMVAEEQYERLVGKSHQPKNLVQFFRQSPLLGVTLDLERDRNPGRDVDL